MMRTEESTTYLDGYLVFLLLGLFDDDSLGSLSSGGSFGDLLGLGLGVWSCSSTIDLGSYLSISVGGTSLGMGGGGLLLDLLISIRYAS